MVEGARDVEGERRESETLSREDDRRRSISGRWGIDIVRSVELDVNSYDATD